MNANFDPRDSLRLNLRLVMNARDFAWLMCLPWLIVQSIDDPAYAVEVVDAPRPNVIVVFTDDQGYQDLGCFGSDTILTPHLDQMANDGMRLTNFYAQPVCGVSRAALMTGCYPIRVAEPANIKRLHTVLHPREWTIGNWCCRVPPIREVRDGGDG